jgi:2-oxo-4-hydroxy-4-carboxy--5-ureidoimidazoline (OHCU) decarboxylase
MAKFFSEIVVRGFSRRLEHIAIDVVLPTVIDTAQAALFVAAEEERRAAVSAVLAEQPDLAVRIAKGDQVFAEKSDTNRGTVGLRDFL